MNSINTTGNDEHVSDNKKLFGILSYLGPLVIIPLLLEKNNHFIKFHMKQGLVLLIIEIILSIFGGMRWSMLSPIYDIIHLALLILIILGIINVIQEKEKELPIVGGLARYFTF